MRKEDQKIEQYIKGIQHTIVVAGFNYEIWLTYKHKKTRKLFLDGEDKYPLFFQTSLHAHFVALIVALYRLFEPRQDTINFNQLMALIEGEGNFSKTKIGNLKRRIKNLTLLWKKVCILRNNVFAHASNKADINQWKKAKITPNDLKKMIKRCQALLNDISHEYNRNSYVFNLSAKSDTLDLLKDLRKISK
ncbi:MAG: hypothetical protein KAJ18_06490 [Candidatus Omnitrophica bacterium]|nr:hypothetical protein [Candidatus Omnitrophota bacterium]